jgi:hypothetical protein
VNSRSFVPYMTPEMVGEIRKFSGLDVNIFPNVVIEGTANARRFTMSFFRETIEGCP